MKKIIKITLGVVLSFILAVSTPIAGVGIMPATVLAATSTAPKASVSKVTLYVGYKTYQVKLENLKKGATTTYKSSNTKIAKVSKNGVITPVKKGKATVTATIKQSSKSYTSKIAVTVDNSNIKFKTKTGNLAVGDVFTFTATTYGTNNKIIWSVSNKKLAAIDSKTGKFTALKAGKVEVVATAGSISSKYTVNIATGKLSAEATELVITDQKVIYITAEDMGSDEYLIFDVKDSNIMGCQWGDWEGDKIQLLLDPYKYGTTTVTITSSDTSDQLVLEVTVKEEPAVRDKNEKPLTAKEIYTKCAPSTVELKVTKVNGDYIGSGFFIASGIMVTNYHVIKDATKIQVVNYKNTAYEVDQILAYDPNYDIAVLTIDAVTEHLVTYKEDINVGENVYALGSPQGLTGSLSNGIVSSASRTFNGTEYVQVTAPISPGNSGGPLLNEFGEVIGINTLYIVDGQNLNFAVNVYQIYKLNYDNAIKADEYYDANMTPKKVSEDESKSGNTGTVQLIENNSLVTGSLHDSNSADGYRISLPNGGTVSAVCMTSNDNDMQNTYFTIIDNDMKTIADSKLYTDDGYYRLLDADLKAGEYYVLVYYGADYVPSTIKYSFLIYY
jgi:S1-C subfamily serine protease